LERAGCALRECLAFVLYSRGAPPTGLQLDGTCVGVNAWEDVNQNGPVNRPVSADSDEKSGAREQRTNRCEIGL